MDWAKAKTILIIAFIITDIFLIYNYVSGGRGTGEIDNTEMLQTVLAESGIYASEIPDEHQDMPALTVQYRAQDEAEVQALIESAGISVDLGLAGGAGSTGGDDGGLRSGAAGELSDEDLAEAYIEAAQDFVEYLGMMSEYAEPAFVAGAESLPLEGKGDHEVVDEVCVYFKCVRNNYEVDGSYMRCIFDDGKLVDFESYWLEPVEFSRRKLPTISASVALITYMTERESMEPVTVEEIEMVYWVSVDSYEGSIVVADTALPAWRLTTDSGEIVHISAIEL